MCFAAPNISNMMLTMASFMVVKKLIKVILINNVDSARQRVENSAYGSVHVFKEIQFKL